MRSFALKIKSFLKMNTLTREEAMRRFMAAKQKKQACVERMTKELSSICEQRGEVVAKLREEREMGRAVEKEKMG